MAKIKVKLSQDPPKEWKPGDTEAINKWYNYIYNQNHGIQINKSLLPSK